MDRSGKPYRDGAGRTLEDYPRPSVAVDTALLTVRPGDDAMSVLQVRLDADGATREEGWALPGTFLHPGERLIDAVLRSLGEKAGIKGARPRQLHVFDEPGRDPRGWVLSVAHAAVVPPGRLSGRLRDRTRLVPADDPGAMPYGHGEIVARAVADLRARYAEHPDPDGLLADPFTVLDLRLVHEAVTGQRLQRDTFRRLMEPRLSRTGTVTSGTRGRPAELFRHPVLSSGLAHFARLRKEAPHDADRDLGPGRLPAEPRREHLRLDNRRAAVVRGP